MSSSVHVVIVNWNTGAYLRGCLTSLASAGRDGVELARVTVVDNASSDGSADGIESLPLPLELIRNDRNAGFAAACNQGAAGSTADYLLFMNPDTRLYPDALALTTAFMNGDGAAGIGICGAEIIDADGRPGISCARFPTLRILTGKMTGLDRLLPRAFPSHHLTAAETARSGPVDQVIGAFFFVRHELFERLDGFDERYFIYFEEVDFALRARRQGARSYFLKEAKVFHQANVSTSEALAMRIHHSLRSRLLYARRHWPRRQASALVLLMLTVEPVARLGRAALRASGSELGATIVAYGRLTLDLVRSGLGRDSPA
jgi:N-acetylglucosaminyl-diphospho-decaprenol L-rhamnosyltransferase